jgi:hypothetical protein
MRETCSEKKPIPFPFVLEELAPLRPTVKKVFGYSYVYLGDKLLFGLRNSISKPGSNGMWLYTGVEHLDSLSKEFPELSRRYLWRSGKNGWVILASKLEGFEELALRACELILRGDPRIGRVSRRRFARPSAGKVEAPTRSKRKEKRDKQ